MARVSLPSRALNDRRVRGCHLRVLAAISELGEGSLSHRQIGSECGIDDRDVRRHIHDLTIFEYITVTLHLGVNSDYSILFNEIKIGEQKTPEGIISPEGEGIKSPTGEEKTPGVKLHLVSPDGPPPLSPCTPLTPPPLNPPSPSKQTRANRLPADWQPSPQNIAYAEGHGFKARSLALLIEDFRDYWHARAGPNALKLDWSKTWARWVRTAAERKDAKYGRQSAHDAETAAFAWVAGADDSGANREDDAPLLDAAGAV